MSITMDVSKRMNMFILFETTMVSHGDARALKCLHETNTLLPIYAFTRAVADVDVLFELRVINCTCELNLH